MATHCLNLAQQLQTKGVSIKFLDTKPRDDKTIPTDLGYDQIQTSLISLSYGFVRLLLQPGLLFSMRGLSLKDIVKVLLLVDRGYRIMRNFPAIRIIHVQHAGTGALAATFLKNCFPVRIVVTVHGAEFTDTALAARWQRVHARVLAAADRIISVSKYTAGYVEQDFPAMRAKLAVIPNGVDLEAFAPKGNVTRHREILFVGDIHPRKGLDTLIEAFRILNSTDWQLHIVGTPGMALPEINRLIAEYDLTERVRISLNLKHKELLNAYQRAAIFVFPTRSNTEGFGLVALEAMASGLPVVASRIAAIPEVVEDGVTGLLFSPGDATDLAQTLTRLISDQALGTALICRGLSRIKERFNWPAVAESTIAVYRELSLS